MSSGLPASVLAARVAPYRWKKGQSGNPRGRPPKSDSMQVVRRLAGEEAASALATIVALMRSAKDEKVRFAAACKVIELADSVEAEALRAQAETLRESAYSLAQQASSAELALLVAHSAEGTRAGFDETPPRGGS